MNNNRLVILTTHFGTNFSGGSKATCEIFGRLQEKFNEIIVVGTELGENPFENLTFMPYRSWYEAVGLLKKLNVPETTFYGDFYNAILLVWANVSFFFTYHDNWPEQRNTSLSNYFKSIYLWSFYKIIFRRASAVVIVSEFRKKMIERYNKNVLLIRNGISKTESQSVFENDKMDVLMVGNIDGRKYDHAIATFNKLNQRGIKINIDVYGHVIDPKVATKLSQFSNVTLKGFEENVPYNNYKCLLHTSSIENLSMAWCEALSHGVPVITFSVGGAAEIINNKNGKLIRPYDIESMVNELKGILSKENGNIASQSNLKDFDWDIASSKYSKLLLKK